MVETSEIKFYASGIALHLVSQLSFSIQTKHDFYQHFKYGNEIFTDVVKAAALPFIKPTAPLHQNPIPLFPENNSNVSKNK